MWSVGTLVNRWTSRRRDSADCRYGIRSMYEHGIPAGPSEVVIGKATHAAHMLRICCATMQRIIREDKGEGGGSCSTLGGAAS